MYRRFLKRLLDFLISLTALLLLWPIILICMLAVRLSSPGPAIFRQRRLGFHGKEFTMLKLRTMKVNSEHTGSGVYSGKDDPRTTKVGRILRKTSLDELPQLINILRGDMALIGPRPPLTYHPWPIDEYSPEQRRMFDARPGITGWAQTHGRKDVEWHRRIELNVWYVEHVSFCLDVKIFFLTVFKVFTNADNANTGKTLDGKK
jgi:sugar transferase EpsL